MTLRVWKGLRAGSPLPVRYLPANPTVNCPRYCPPQPMPADPNTPAHSACECGQEFDWEDA